MVIAKSGGQFELSCEPRKKVCVLTRLEAQDGLDSLFPKPQQFHSFTVSGPGIFPRV